MPLLRFEVRNEYGLADPELLTVASRGEDEPRALLDAVAVAGLVGVLRQLGDLAEFAADIFHDLHEQIIMTAARGRRIMTRVQSIETALPSLEKAVKGQTSHVHFAYLAGCRWHSKLQTEEILLLSSDLPRFMMDTYEECRDPPKLYLLDKFDSAGAGACLKRYSDPSYFKKSWDLLNVERNANHNKEKKKNIKRRGSHLRSGSFHYELSLTSQRDGAFHRSQSASQYAGNRKLASPSPDRQGCSDKRSTVDVQSNPGVANVSSVGLESRANTVEQDFSNCPSIASLANRHEKLPVDVTQYMLNEASSSFLSGNIGVGGDGCVNDTRYDLLYNHRSSSVTWDEKEEIFIGPSEILYHDKIVDKIQHTDTICNDSVKDKINQAGDDTMEHHVILHEKVKLLVPTAALTNLEEVTTETDNNTDALNSVDSEEGTEFQTETETKPDSCIKEIQSSVPLQNDSVDAEIFDTSLPSQFDSSYTLDARKLIDFIKEPPSKNDSVLRDVNKLVQGDGVDSDELVNSQQAIDDHEVCTLKVRGSCSENNICTNESDATMKIKTESVHCNGCLETSEASMFTTNSSAIVQDVLECNEEVTSVMYENEDASYNDLPQRSVSDPVMDGGSNSKVHGTTSVKQDASTMSPDSVTTAKLWTNAGLFGFMPSKPPDFGSEKGLQSAVACAPAETLCHLGGVSGQSGQSAVPRSEQVDVLVGNVSGYSNFADSEMAQGTVLPSDNDGHGCVTIQQAISNHNDIQAQPVASPDSNLANMWLSRQRDTSFSPSQLQPSTEPASSYIFDSTRSISASFSSIAQKFLVNTLQRKVCLSKSDQPSTSQAEKLNVKGHDDQYYVGKCNTDSNEDSMTGAVMSSLLINRHYSEQSSPPLEFMKISSHPMNVQELSYLKSEFSNGNRHGDANSLGLSTCIPLGSSFPSAESDTESDEDDDTFGKSYNYSSNDDLSRFCSNSETWEEQDISSIMEHEFYGDLGLFQTSMLAGVRTGLETINIPSSVDNVNGMDVKDGAENMVAHPVAELPNFISVFGVNSQQNNSVQSTIRKPSNLLEDHSDMPPPPPLPPMQWRVMKSTTQDSVSNTTTVNKVQDAPNPRSTCAPFAELHEQTSIKPPPFPLSTQDKKTQRATDGSRKSRTADNDNKDLDEREELLHQIRSKTFNLRHTGLRRVDLRRTASPNPTPTSPQTATNDNVSAILEKASALRQAFVGSDDGADDDSWSDT